MTAVPETCGLLLVHEIVRCNGQQLAACASLDFSFQEQEQFWTTVQVVEQWIKHARRPSRAFANVRPPPPVPRMTAEQASAGRCRDAAALLPAPQARAAKTPARQDVTSVTAAAPMEASVTTPPTPESSSSTLATVVALQTEPTVDAAPSHAVAARAPVARRGAGRGPRRGTGRACGNIT